MTRRLLACAALGLLHLAVADALLAQQPPLSQPLAPSPAPPLRVSPRGAFVRAVLVPGWGHAAIGSYRRGGFYVALESLTAYTFLRTRTRLSDARERAAFRERFVRETLASEGVTDTTLVANRVAQDQVLGGLQDLVASRENQQEDLVAWGIFVLFLTGADAYVSAHLSRFPTPIQVQAGPAPGGGAEVAVRVLLPR